VDESRIRAPLDTPPEPDAESDAHARHGTASPGRARAGDDPPQWVELVHNLHGASELPEQVAASRRAADAARRVIAGLAGTQVDPATLDEVAASLEHLAGVLAPHQPRSRYDGTSGLHGGVTADWRVWESHPFLGPSHPLAPPIRIERHGDRAVGTVTFGHVYEGPPGAVHGGIVAAMFDLALGSAASLAQRPGLTGTLTVRYRKATPLYREIRYEAWIDRVEERKVLVAATSTCDGDVLADAHGIFVRVDQRRYDPPAS
jgi:acyl-coenzyme A thioesterase PaaI-like protein